jgi:hypothetical protein
MKTREEELAAYQRGVEWKARVDRENALRQFAERIRVTNIDLAAYLWDLEQRIDRLEGLVGSLWEVVGKGGQ